MIYLSYISKIIEILISIIAVGLSIIFIYSFITRKDIYYSSKYFSLEIKHHK